MELKRTLIAVALSMVVLVAFNYFVPGKRVVKPPPKGASRAAKVEPTPREAPAPAPAATPVAAPAPVPVAGAGAGGPAAPVTRAVLENDLITVGLTSRGAAIDEVRLKQYKDRPGPEGKPVELLSAASGVDRVGETRFLGGPVSGEANFAEVQKGPDRVVYVWDGPNGLRVEKIYTLGKGRYDVGLTVQVRNTGASTVNERLALVMVQDYSAGQDRYAFTGPAYLKSGDLKEVKLKAVKKEAKVDSGDIAWGALVDKYFLIAAIPGHPEGTAIRMERYRGMEKAVEVQLDSPAADVAPGAEAARSYRIYAGPKLVAALAPLGADLDKAVDYGWFQLIAKPLLSFLNLIYSFTGNYGVAIIILTALVKAVFWPLSARSYRSMQKMKELQPKMQKLKERHGKDRERLNMEVMQLYKTHKVNPLGGCLPMVLQIPVFFALYRVLLNSIELRQAPFFWWIQDLSAKDPYYITPIIMGITMFLQQKMTPATGTDATQMKLMMYGMPLIFTFMFLNFPSGLVIYWLVNNLLSIGQQGMMLRQSKKTAAA